MLVGMLRGANARCSDRFAAVQIPAAVLTAVLMLDCDAVAECQT